MTSSNGDVFRVTGPLCGEFTGHRWIPSTKASDAELWCFLWFAPWINGWVNNREAGDLRRHRAHFDVIVMERQGYWLKSLPVWVDKRYHVHFRPDIIYGNAGLFFSKYIVMCAVNWIISLRRLYSGKTAKLCIFPAIRYFEQLMHWSHYGLTHVLTR